MTADLLAGSLMPGPLMIDVAGLTLDGHDRKLIAHPLVGGVILFSRNYESTEQLATLVQEMRACRNGPLLIATDQEGGRVQRFRQGFTTIPPMRKFGDRFDTDRQVAIAAVQDTATLLAMELRQCDLDFSFAPVVDIDHDTASVIGDRAFHHTIEGVVALATAAIDGFARAGMASVIKHFPGHGSVSVDTHVGIARDSRPYAEIESGDLKPFMDLCKTCAAVMPAHVVYDQVDSSPASLSSVWLTGILRDTLKFTGAVISDDLSMGAVTNIAHQSITAKLALDAGTDLVLICNDRSAVIETINAQSLPTGDSASVRRRLSLLSKPSTPLTTDKKAFIQRQLLAMR